MIRFGVIGTNWITDFFIEAGKQHQQFELTAVCSRTMEKAEQYADKHSIPFKFTNVEEMAAVVDAVYIATPNSLHAEYAIQMMKQGIHVLCEKPIASNTQQLHEMIQTAKKYNVLLMEAIKSTLMPAFSVIQENMKQIGKVRRYFASYCQYSSRYDAYREGTVLNAFRPEFSNGSLMDIGIYCIYPAVVLFGKPNSVKATGYMLESGVDGEGSLLLQYDEMDAVMMYSKISNSTLHSEIQAEDGTIHINRINEPDLVTVHKRNSSTETIDASYKQHSMYYEIDEFIRLLLEGKVESKVNTHQASLITMEIMDEARKQLGLRYAADDQR